MIEPVAHDASAPPEVRGTAFLGLLEHIRESAGPDVLARVVEAGGEPTQAVFAERIRKLAWYDYRAYAAFLRAADRELGDGDGRYCVTLGEVASRRDLSTVFSFFTRIYGPQRLIRACTRVWDQYYRNAGAMAAVEWEPERTVLRITGFGDMAREHCHLMQGWMWSAMDTLGVRVIDGQESQCASRGAPFHEFTCSWQR